MYVLANIDKQKPCKTSFSFTYHPSAPFHPNNEGLETFKSTHTSPGLKNNGNHQTRFATQTLGTSRSGKHQCLEVHARRQRQIWPSDEELGRLARMVRQIELGLLGRSLQEVCILDLYPEIQKRC
jgi:hypothetical protein